MRGLVTALMLASAMPAYAATCAAGSSKAIQLGDWSATPVDEATVKIDLVLTSTLKKAVRMADVYVGFKDRLGGDIGAFEFPPDFAIAPGQTVVFSREVGALVMPRLTKVSRGDVLPFFCVNAVVYDDGATQRF